MMTERLLTTAEVCQLLSVSRWTLKKWDDSGRLPAIRTDGGHRRYRQSDVYKFMGQEVESLINLDLTAVYCRVSSHDQKQKGDLDRQQEFTNIA
jgi:excisionase family DNA binding protein